MKEKYGKGPYPATTAGLGGLPTVSVDVPISAVFIFLFLTGAICHFTILQINRKRRGHKFIISGMMGGFCMSRVATMALRIAWATHPTNVNLAIAASVFVTAGVVLLFIVNILFAQRIVRACHPNAGWSKTLHYGFVVLYVLIVLNLLMIVATVIYSDFTLNPNIKRSIRDIVLYVQTFYTIIAFLPIPMVIGGILIPRKTRLEKFGHGRFRTKVAFLLGTSFLLCLGASFRAGTNFAGGDRPISDHPAYFSKACFYIFNFAIEIIVILCYVIIRVDKRFYVPDHSKMAGDYSRGPDWYTRREQAWRDREHGDVGLDSMVATEEEVFDDMSHEEVADRDGMKSGVDEERGIPLETKPEPIQTPEPVLAAGFPTKLPPTPAATPPPSERLAFPGTVIPTSNA